MTYVVPEYSTTLQFLFVYYSIFRLFHTQNLVCQQLHRDTYVLLCSIRFYYAKRGTTFSRRRDQMYRVHRQLIAYGRDNAV